MILVVLCRRCFTLLFTAHTQNCLHDPSIEYIKSKRRRSTASWDKRRCWWNEPKEMQWMDYGSGQAAVKRKSVEQSRYTRKKGATPLSVLTKRENWNIRFCDRFYIFLFIQLMRSSEEGLILIAKVAGSASSVVPAYFNNVAKALFNWSTAFPFFVQIL